MIRQIIDKYRGHKKDLLVIFLDLKKEYDRGPRGLMWWATKVPKM